MARRTSINIDDDLVAQAQVALGTSGIKATVEAALHAAIGAARRQRLLDRLIDPDGLDDEALDEARRSWDDR